MTVRELVNRRLRRAQLALLLFFAILIISIASEFVPFGLGKPAVLVALLLSIGIQRLGIPCPRCGNAMGALVSLPKGGMWFRLSSALRFCPFCGLAVDTELSDARRSHQVTAGVGDTRSSHLP